MADLDEFSDELKETIRFILSYEQQSGYVFADTYLEEPGEIWLLF